MYLEIETKKYGIVKYQISKEDLEKIKRLKLYVSYCKHTKSLYLITKEKKYLHRIIMEAKKGEIVDHINHDTLDNRRENLRIVTFAENIQNSLKAYKDEQKLSKKEVEIILRSEKSNNELAKLYNVSNCLISKIRSGKMYKNYCIDIERRKSKARGKIISKEKKKIIKEKVLNCKTSLYKLAKELNFPANRLYQIRDKKIWKDI